MTDLSPHVVPTIVIIGPCGVGKSTILAEVSCQAESLDIPHAGIDVEHVRWVHPAHPIEGNQLKQLRARNVAALWSAYQAVGVTHLVLVPDGGVCRRADLDWLSQVVPGASCTIFRLHASLDILLTRIDRREMGGAGEEPCRRYAREDSAVFEHYAPEDHLIETGGRNVRDIGAEIIRLSGWQRDSSARLGERAKQDQWLQ